MKGKIVVGSNGFSQYILTLTLYDHLCSFKRVGLKIPDRAEIDEVEGGLIQKIKKTFAGSKSVVEIIQFGDFCDGIVSAAKEIKVRMPDATIITTTPMISYEAGGTCIGLSRLIDFEGNIISVGSRAGSGSVESQIELVSRELAGKRVIILEDGAFTGSTLCFMIDQLSKRKVNVAAIVMGILFPDAKERLAKTFTGELVWHYHFEKPVDWMPSHDFFPFVPNAGRVIGVKVGESLIPVHLFDRSTLSKPYILPYGKLKEWAGLPMSQDELLWLSQYCIMSTIKIFQRMEELNSRPVCVGDLLDTRPITSVPVAYGRKLVEFYSLGDRVIDLLNNDYARLNEVD